MKTSKITTILLCIMAIILMSSCTNNNGKKENMPPKYIFLFIGDGMSYNNVALAESYLSYKSGKLGGEQLLFTTFPEFGSATSHSANRRVTDSSASGTAISTGSKTNNAMLGVDPEGNKLRSMSYDLHDMGYNVGIISSVPVNHATPASFYASKNSRYDYYTITEQLPGSGFEYFAAAGMINYYGDDDESPKDGADIMLEKQGVNVCFSIEEAKEAIKNGDMMLVCQPYNKNREASNYDAGGATPADHISLSKMLELGLERLTDEKPFFIMCEGGEIDWAAHSQKTFPTVFSIIEFDNAISVAYEFYKAHPEETLIVVTADHGTGGSAFSEDPEWEALEKIWTESGCKNELNGQDNKKMNEQYNFDWSTRGHTGEPVPVYAVGKGAEKFAGRMDNTEFKAKILGR